MAKQKTTFLDSGITTLSGLYDKYNKDGMVQKPPEDLETLNFDDERLATPFLHLELYLGGGPALGKISTYSGMFSTGKCLGKGTKIILEDGTLKNVEDIVVGDRLLGTENKSTTVLTTNFGREQMYWIRQSKGKDYRVNASHILSLKHRANSRENIINKSVKNILSDEYNLKTFQRSYKGYKLNKEVEFNFKNLKIDPYFLGLWLSDGSKDNATITTDDELIVDYIHFIAKQYDLKVMKHDSNGSRCPSYHISSGTSNKVNALLTQLKSYNLIGNKHIPKDYLSSSIEQRLELLAGLLDGDGYLDRRSGGFEITQKSSILSNLIVTLSESCGLHASNNKKEGYIDRVFKGVYNRVYIWGHTHKIPTRLSRKIMPYFNKKRESHYSKIFIEKDIVDDFYGFTLDGNNLFMLEDYTVTHNTSMALANAGANPGLKIGFVDAEFNWVNSSYKWVKDKFNINPSSIIVLQPDYQEEAAEMVADLCDVVDIIIFDGFDMLAPKAEYEDSMESNKMGLMARTYKQMFRKMMGKVYRTKTAFMITNHLYENIGNVFEPFKEPGGKSIGDFPSQKLFLTRSQAKDAEKNVTGQWVNCTVNKDKLTGNRGFKFKLLYNNATGFDYEQEILDLGVKYNVLVKKGSWWAYEGKNFGQGDIKAKDYLKLNPEIMKTMRQQIKDAYKIVKDAERESDDK